MQLNFKSAQNGRQKMRQNSAHQTVNVGRTGSFALTCGNVRQLPLRAHYRRWENDQMNSSKDDKPLR